MNNFAAAACTREVVWIWKDDYGMPYRWLVVAVAPILVATAVLSQHVTSSLSTSPAKQFVSVSSLLWASRQYQAVSTPLAHTELFFGDHGKAVGILQTRLKKIGLYHGPIDAVYNGQTKTAIEALQKDGGLPVSAIVDAATQGLLDSWVQASRESLVAPVSLRTHNASANPPAVTATATVSPTTSSPPPVSAQSLVLGYYTQYSPQSVSSQQTLSANLNTINAIAPLWYSYRKNGSLETHGYNRAAIRAYAYGRGVSVLPLVTNAGLNDQILINPALRQTVVDSLTHLAVTDGYQGFNIDFEGLNYWDQAGLTAFVAALSQRLHPMGKMVTIAIIPKTASDPYGRAYNQSALGQYADKVVLMTYDHHDIGSSAGPVAPLPWVSAAVNYSLSQMPSNKIVLGLAAYGYNWSSTGQTVEVHDLGAVRLAAQHGAPISWDAVSQEPTFHYSVGGVTHTVWYENGYSDAAKIQLARADHLGGVAIWRLGDQDPYLFTAINRYWYGR